MRGLVLLLALIAAEAHAGVLTVGQPAVELDVAVDAAGKPFKLAAFRGRWVVITIGAAWCAPCQAELPVWNKLAGELAGRVSFISLALDNDIADGKAFHKRLAIGNLLRAYLPEELSKIGDRYGAATMPSTFVIGPDGVIRYIQPGFDKANATSEYTKLKTSLLALLPPKQTPKSPRPPPRAPVSRVPSLLLPRAHVALWADGWTLAF